MPEKLRQGQGSRVRKGTRQTGWKVIFTSSSSSSLYAPLPSRSRNVQKKEGQISTALRSRRTSGSASPAFLPPHRRLTLSSSTSYCAARHQRHGSYSNRCIVLSSTCGIEFGLSEEPLPNFLLLSTVCVSHYGHAQVCGPR